MECTLKVETDSVWCGDTERGFKGEAAECETRPQSAFHLMVFMHDYNCGNGDKQRSSHPDASYSEAKTERDTKSLQLKLLYCFLSLIHLFVFHFCLFVFL